MTNSGNTANIALTCTNSPSAYATGQEFEFVAPATNPVGANIAVGSLASLPAYRDTPAVGPIGLIGDEISQGNLIRAIYDAALNSGAGGFHILPATDMPPTFTQGSSSGPWTCINRNALYTSKGTPQRDGDDGTAGDSCSIGTRTSNNGVLVTVTWNAGTDAGVVEGLTIYRTINGVETNLANLLPGAPTYIEEFTSLNQSYNTSQSFTFFDAPCQIPAGAGCSNTAGASVTYDLRFADLSGTGNVYLNRTSSGATIVGTSEITLQEVWGQ